MCESRCELVCSSDGVCKKDNGSAICEKMKICQMDQIGTKSGQGRGRVNLVYEAVLRCRYVHVASSVREMGNCG